MRVEDYYPTGKRWWFRLHEMGGKRHEVPAHHNAEAYLDAYIDAAGIGEDKKGPLFRTVGRNRQITRTPMHRTDHVGGSGTVVPKTGPVFDGSERRKVG